MHGCGGHVWLQGDMCGCGGHSWLWGECMIAVAGEACVGYDEILSIPTGMHSCLINVDNYK